jgi:hypothetical protein
VLPEGALRDYLAKRASTKPIREYLLLEVLGLDLPGAALVRPVRERAVDKMINTMVMTKALRVRAR